MHITVFFGVSDTLGFLLFQLRDTIFFTLLRNCGFFFIKLSNQFF